MRELTREEKLRIAAEADRIHGVFAFPEDEQVAEATIAIAGEWPDADWYCTVRRLANDATTDKLTPSERETVEEWRESHQPELVRELFAIIDRLAPKVAP